MKKIILAPISINNQFAVDNYKHEMAEAEAFRPCMWDGEVNGKDEINDFFGFVDTINDTITLTRVITVLGPTAGRRHWGETPSLQASGKDKNVLVLDYFFKTISYSQYKKDAGYKPNLVLSGTKRLDWPY
jgi:hypothetical protein